MFLFTDGVSAPQRTALAAHRKTLVEIEQAAADLR
jgi:hypothetical protein